MISIAEYRRFAEECREMAARTTNQNDKRALELMAAGWEKVAQRARSATHDEDSIGRVMSEQSRKTAPTNPPCPKCGTPMPVTLVMAPGSDEETRTYNCAACGHSETTTVN
jgi:hypothetical protein